MRRWMSCGPRPALLGVGVAAALGMVLVGSATVPPAEPAAAGAAEERPQVELRADQRPIIEISDAVGALGGSLDDAAARRLTGEVIEGLLLADRAVEQSDPGLAATVATGPYRDELIGRSPEPAPDRTIRSAVIGVVENPDDFQAVPRLSIALDGTENGAPWATMLHVWVTSAGAFIEREVSADGQ